MLVLVHVAPQRLVATTRPPVPSVVQVATRVCEPAVPQVPWHVPTVWYVQEYVVQIGTVQGVVVGAQPPWQLAAEAGCWVPPHWLVARHWLVLRSTPVHEVGSLLQLGWEAPGQVRRALLSVLPSTKVVMASVPQYVVRAKFCSM